MRLTINLATQPYQDVRQFVLRWSMAVALVGLLTIGLLYAAISTIHSWRSEARQEVQLQREIAERDHIRDSAEAYLNKPENRSTHEESNFLNGLIARKAFSWTEVLSDLERLMPAGIHVIGIQPEVNESGQLLLRFTVVGQSRDRAIELVRKMEDSPHFRNAGMTSESAVKTRDIGQMQFQIAAIYVPPYERIMAREAQLTSSQPPEGATR